MNRKTKIGIIVLLVILLAIGIWCVVQKNNEKNQNQKLPVPQSETESERIIITSTPSSQTYSYIVRAEDAMLVVYLADGHTVYMETGIRTDRLSEDMQEKAKRGIGFATLEQLYDFLESYAS